MYCFYPRYESIKDSRKIARFDRFYGEYEVIGNNMQWLKITDAVIYSDDN
jgi:hypothetical protein